MIVFLRPLGLRLIGFITFLALGWQFSHKRPTRGILEPDA
ncbi:hypothetical protein OUHCRE19_42970 [Enterobacter asburiae]